MSFRGWPRLAGLKCATLVTAHPDTTNLIRQLPAETQMRTGYLGVLASIAAYEARRYRNLTGGGTVTMVAGPGQDTHFVDPLPPSDHPDLIAARPTVRRPVDPRRLPGVTALDGRGRVAGTERRIVCVHSANLQAAQSRALARDLAHAARRLDELATALPTGS